MTNREYSALEKKGFATSAWALRAAAALALFSVNWFACGGVRAEPEIISMELNKLEPQGQSCRAYIVVNNPSPTAYGAFKLDLVVFQPDGVVGRRFAIDLAPLRANKRTVKLFDIDQTSCDQIASLLVNDVLECKAGETPVDDCLARLAPSSIAKALLSK